MNIKRYSVLKLERMVHAYKFIFHQMGQTKKDNLLFYICIKKVVRSEKGSVCFHRLPRSVQLDYIKTRFIYLNFMNL